MIACFAFISLGLPDAILGVAWPSVSHVVQEPIHHLGWLVSCGFMGYLIATIGASHMVRILGVGRLLILSSGSMVIVLTGYALASAWPIWLGLAFVGGLSGGSIDAAINAFASKKFSARLLNWMHASWGIGASLGPLAMTTLLANHVSWRVGYGILATLLFAMTLALIATRSNWNDSEPSSMEEEISHGNWEAIRHVRVRWMCLLYWVYTGVESVAGYLLFSFLTTERGYDIVVAGVTTSAFWGSLTVGRIVFGQVVMQIQKEKVLRTVASMAILASILIAFPSSLSLDLIGACLFGFSLAPIFPTWISLTPDYVGKRYSTSSIGLQIGFAAIGVATFPFLIGELSSRWGFETMPRFLILGTIVLLLIQEIPLRAIAKEHELR